MTETFIALDVETTGLDPETDGVTEVAAVRFDWAGNALATFQSFVDPEREIPPFAEALTGLRADDLQDAPTLQQLAADLRRFAGEDLVVGHNIEFDRAFLERAGCRLRGPSADTVALSRILLPESPSHSLASVAAVLGIDPGTSHRALADATTVGRIFVALLHRTRALDEAIRFQLARLAAPESITLAELVAGQGWESVAQQTVDQQPAPWTAPTSLSRAVEPHPLDAGLSARVLAAGASVVDGFEERVEQVQMAESVAEALSHGGQWLIEAGTGVGKSLAYLVPAALHALRTGERVVVSTNTIALQEQLLTKDLSTLRSLLAAAGAIDKADELRVTVLKGRGNYLCYRRWRAGLAGSQDDPDFSRLASRVLLWLPKTATGDRSELSLDPRMRAVWARFSAEGADCLSRQNVEVRAGQCFLARARREAEAAHIVIVNHALLLADVATGRSALPAFEHLVVDEAHNLEEQATRQFGRRASRRILNEVLAPLWRPSGAGERPGGIASVLRSLPDEAARRAGDEIAAAVEAAIDPAVAVCAQIATVRRESGEPELLITRGIRNGDGWSALEMRWLALDSALQRLLAASVSAEAATRTDDEEGGDDLFASEIETASTRVAELQTNMRTMISEPDSNDIVWAAEDGEGLGTLGSAPLEVGPVLTERLFSGLRTVIATSATLGAAGSMRFTAERLGLPEADTVEIGSPFDYQRCALLAEVTDVPDPGGEAYPESVASALEQLIGAAEGRALVLFTSHAALRDAARRTREGLRSRGVLVLAQDLDGRPAELVRVLRTRPGTAVYGTASFWEGVDIRGEALSLLIIVRLPFAVPTDPIQQARSGLYHDPFREYSLPAAILRFRQGFGRLIRDGQDRGMIAVLDRRLASRRYGREFIRALPSCRRFRGPAEAVAGELRRWLGEP